MYLLRYGNKASTSRRLHHSREIYDLTIFHDPLNNLSAATVCIHSRRQLATGSIDGGDYGFSVGRSKLKGIVDRFFYRFGKLDPRLRRGVSLHRKRSRWRRRPTVGFGDAGGST